MSVMGDVTPPARGLLPLPHVQFWETENSGRLDRSHCGSHRRDIPRLVDASDVRTLNAFKTPTECQLPANRVDGVSAGRRQSGRPENPFAGNSAARRRRKIGPEKCHRRDRPIQTGNRPLPQRDHGSDHVIEQSADGRQSANAADDGERSAHRGAGRDLE